MLIIRPQDRDIPMTGCEHKLSMCGNEYLIFCNFQFMIWLESAYNSILNFHGQDRLSIRGLLKRMIDEQFDLTLLEICHLSDKIVKEWFNKDYDPDKLSLKDIDIFPYAIGHILGLLVGGADAGKKLSIILALHHRVAKRSRSQTENLTR